SLKRYRYTSKERDEESRLYYHGARYYAPWLGRWTSCDSAGAAEGPGRYTYVRNNPVRLFDPNGMWGVEMHFAAVYWSGRLAGVTHREALAAAIASQSPDDFFFTKAPTMKPFGLFIDTKNSSKIEQLMNAWHALNVTKEESELVAKIAIHAQIRTSGSSRLNRGKVRLSRKWGSSHTLPRNAPQQHQEDGHGPHN